MSQQAETALERELAHEQTHVDRVYRFLGLATESAREVASHGQALYQSDRTDYLRDDDSTALFERDAFSFQAAKRLATLDAEHDGLVFGRLDDHAGETRYIGRIGVRDDDYEPLVIDWRARAAEPFYRATSANPMDIVRRRVLRCRGDKVIGIEDDLLDASNDNNLAIIGEGALMASLRRARGHRMRDIVSTIQAEQDEAIRAPHSGFTFISGGPGTGKTVVALHRVAYLLYSNRARFERGGILVVGPSPVFMNYIDRVLPSLGEDSVTLRSVGAVASDVVDVRAVRIDAPDAAAVKGSLRMVAALRAIATTDPTEPEPIKVTVKGEVLSLPPQRLARLRASVLSRQRSNQAFPAARDAVVNALYQQLPAEYDLSPADFADLIDTERFARAVEAWWPVLEPRAVLARLSDRAYATRALGGILPAPEIATLRDSYAGITDPASFEWSVADAALLDELADILGPLPAEEPTLFLDRLADEHAVVTTADRLSRRTVETSLDDEPYETYAHVLVDEAQDITPMQWRMLRRRGGRASWTIVGDAAQSSWPDAAEAAAALDQLVGTAPRRDFTLTTNYRSPAEVFELAARVVRESYPEVHLPTAIRHTGVYPRLLISPAGEWRDDIAAHIVDIAGKVEGTVGVIAPPSRLHAVRRLAAEHLSQLGARLVIVTPLEAKGLEYDGVLVISPDDVAAESPGGVRVLYVALTRPTQLLVTLDIGRKGSWRRSLELPATDSA
ncbi:HelD family protein [Propionicicella superfundia]|uniref:HelD family protein n=1 Tax=Propionicicella superfundia TaxID=348582 RepID=UPI00056B1A54|nr:UvrD-helicase domain-containing protein [Propionicicella superfundia]